jgi:NH3-dependent NAD+ synthetase
LGNLNKKEIYEFARWINKTYNGVIPSEIITRPASAELSDDQVDPFDYELISSSVYNYFFGKI